MDYKIVWEGDLVFFVSPEYHVDYIIDFNDKKIYKASDENR